MLNREQKLLEAHKAAREKALEEAMTAIEEIDKLTQQIFTQQSARSMEVYSTLPQPVQQNVLDEAIERHAAKLRMFGAKREQANSRFFSILNSSSSDPKFVRREEQIAQRVAEVANLQEKIAYREERIANLQLEQRCVERELQDRRGMFSCDPLDWVLTAGSKP